MITLLFTQPRCTKKAERRIKIARRRSERNKAAARIAGNDLKIHQKNP